MVHSKTNEDEQSGTKFLEKQQGKLRPCGAINREFILNAVLVQQYREMSC